MTTTGSSIVCEKCGKKLIKRLTNGQWHFVFGRDPDLPGDPPVELYIFGSLKMKCIRRSCRHWNIFNHLPFTKASV